MYKIKRVSKINKIDTHLNVEPNADVDEFGSYEYDPSNFRKCFMPEEVIGIPNFAEKELKEKGETTFSFSKTVTINIKTTQPTEKES